MHIAFPGWKVYPPVWKISGGTEPKRAIHHTAAVYIKILCLRNNTMYLVGFTTQKYRLTAMTPMVSRDDIENVKIAKPCSRQTVVPNIHLPWTREAIEKGIPQTDINKSLTASAITNILASERSLWFLYTAQQTEMLPEMAIMLIIARKTASVQIKGGALLRSPL